MLDHSFSGLRNVEFDGASSHLIIAPNLYIQAPLPGFREHRLCHIYTGVDGRRFVNLGVLVLCCFDL